jgi:glycosyltransferase involved in cell wall biosynthesis
MVIAVNTRLLIKNKLEGIGWYTYETLKRITQANKQHQFIFIFDRPYSDEFIFADNITPLIAWPQARHPFLWYWWFEKTIPKVLKKHRADLFLSTDGYLSLAAEIPQVCVMHDINFEHYPQDLPALVKWYYKKYSPLYARKAKRIITVSDFSKQDIIDKYKIDSSKIDFAYNGASAEFAIADEQTKKQVRKKLTGGENYFLYVGSIHPRKNVERLLQAFEKYKTDTAEKTKLVIVGEKMSWVKKTSATCENIKHKTDIIFTGRLPLSELKKIYGAALALAYIPYFEGFGIPLAEAMHSGIPIITSDVTSMPEVAGNAAITVNPFDINAIAEAMKKMAGDDTLRNELIKNGQARKDLFNWDNTAQALWQAIEKSMS